MHGQSGPPSIIEIPTALLYESESLRLEREGLLQERLTCLTNIVKLNEDQVNLHSRFSRIIKLGLHSFEELAALAERGDLGDGRSGLVIW